MHIRVQFNNDNSIRTVQTFLKIKDKNNMWIWGFGGVNKVPFHSQAYVIKIHVSMEGYSLYVENKYISELKHRHDMKLVRSVYITGYTNISEIGFYPYGSKLHFIVHIEFTVNVCVCMYDKNVLYTIY